MTRTRRLLFKREYRAFQIFQSMAGLGRIGKSGVRQFGDRIGGKGDMGTLGLKIGGVGRERELGYWGIRELRDKWIGAKRPLGNQGTGMTGGIEGLGYFQL